MKLLREHVLKHLPHYMRGERGVLLTLSDGGAGRGVLLSGSSTITITIGLASHVNTFSRRFLTRLHLQGCNGQSITDSVTCWQMNTSSSRLPIFVSHRQTLR